MYFHFQVASHERAKRVEWRWRELNARATEAYEQIYKI
jgi:hypothetical protein